MGSAGGDPVLLAVYELRGFREPEGARHLTRPRHVHCAGVSFVAGRVVVVADKVSGHLVEVELSAPLLGGGGGGGGGGLGGGGGGGGGGGRGGGGAAAAAAGGGGGGGAGAGGEGRACAHPGPSTPSPHTPACVGCKAGSVAPPGGPIAAESRSVAAGAVGHVAAEGTATRADPHEAEAASPGGAVLDDPAPQMLSDEAAAVSVRRGGSSGRSSGASAAAWPSRRGVSVGSCAARRTRRTRVATAQPARSVSGSSPLEKPSLASHVVRAMLARPRSRPLPPPLPSPRGGSMRSTRSSCRVRGRGAWAEMRQALPDRNGRAVRPFFSAEPKGRGRRARLG